MAQTLFLILATSLWTIGIFKATGEGHRLHGLSVAAARLLGQSVTKPIFGCPYCMPSFHGYFIVGLFHLFFGFHVPMYWYVLQWLFIIPCASALNYILLPLMRILMGYADLFDEEPPCAEIEGIQTKIIK